MSLKIMARLEAWSDEISVAAILASETGRSYALPLTLQKINDGMMIEPFCKLNKTEAQVLMDSLWDCGLRPSSGSGSAGAMAATQKHLEDMRTLVFKMPPKQ